MMDCKSARVGYLDVHKVLIVIDCKSVAKIQRKSRMCAV